MPVSEDVAHRAKQLVGRSQGLLCGFGRLLHNDGGNSIWFNFAGEQAPLHHLRQLSAGNRLEWETEPVPFESDDPFACFVFAGAFGELTEPPTAGFTLLVNGDECLDFDVTGSAELWESSDGRAALLFSRRWRSDQDSAGFFYLAVSRQLIEPGAPCRLGVKCKESDSERWFGLNPETDAVSLQIEK